MTTMRLTSTAALIVTLLLITVASVMNVDWLWGVNHLQYLGNFIWYVFGLLVIGSLYFAFGRLPEKNLDTAAEKLSDIVWGRSFALRMALVLVCTAIFFFMRVQTAFLGDGYFLLNIFGRHEAYTADLIKPLSIFIINNVQFLFGGHSYETARYAFQTLSIVSGFFTVFNFIVIAGLLSRTAWGRLLNLAVLLFSGWSLLFFGYVEYYPMLWLAASFFVRFALEFVKGHRSLWIVLVSFVITAVIHAQTIYFLPGLLYLIAYKMSPDAVDKLSAKVFALLTVIIPIAAIVAVLLAGRMMTSGANPFLPLLPLGNSFPFYAVLSTRNLAEIANLALLCCPALLILITGIGRHAQSETDHTARLLALFSVGSLMFVLTMDPVLGMARDFDLMSLTLLAPVLLILYLVNRTTKRVTMRFVMVCVVVSLLVSASYLQANVSVASSESRIHDLLRYYGAKERGGWSSFAGYLQNKKDMVTHDEVVREMDAVFPDQQKYRNVLSLLSAGKLEAASTLAEELVVSQPDNGEFLAALGQVKMRQGEYDRAARLYEMAIKTHPNHHNYIALGRIRLLLEDYAGAVKALETADKLSPNSGEITMLMCNAHFMAGDLDRAAALADRMFEIRPHSPDACIFYILYSVEIGDLAQAKKYYREFLEYGTSHWEYEGIKVEYKYLLDEP